MRKDLPKMPSDPRIQHHFSNINDSYGMLNVSSSMWSCPIFHINLNAFAIEFCVGKLQSVCLNVFGHAVNCWNQWTSKMNGRKGLCGWWMLQLEATIIWLWARATSSSSSLTSWSLASLCTTMNGLKSMHAVTLICPVLHSKLWLGLKKMAFDSFASVASFFFSVGLKN